MFRRKSLKIFICAHKKIENELPKNKRYYTLCFQDSNLSDDRLPNMYINNEFTERWHVSYSEGCLLYYLWKNPQILPQYVGINHYRRFFKDYYKKPSKALKTLKNKQAIIMHDYTHPKPLTNGIVMRLCHPSYDADLIEGIIKRYYNGYYQAFLETEHSNKQYPCNMFIMNRIDFLEMCEFAFGVLNKYNEHQHFTCDNDVREYIKKMRIDNNECYYMNFKWQVRLHGFWLEWLTETYWRKKYGIENCAVSDYYLLIEQNVPVSSMNLV